VGAILVDATYHLDVGYPCSVSLPNDPCPTNNNIRATKFLFPDANKNCTLDSPLNLGDPICGEVDLFNTTGNGVILSAIRCSRLSTTTTFGSKVPVFPIPAPK
jgi:hypothetical protein